MEPAYKHQQMTTCQANYWSGSNSMRARATGAAPSDCFPIQGARDVATKSKQRSSEQVTAISQTQRNMAIYVENPKTGKITEEDGEISLSAFSSGEAITELFHSPPSPFSCFVSVLWSPSSPHSGCLSWVSIC